MYVPNIPAKAGSEAEHTYLHIYKLARETTTIYEIIIPNWMHAIWRSEHRHRVDRSYYTIAKRKTVIFVVVDFVPKCQSKLSGRLLMEIKNKHTLEWIASIWNYRKDNGEMAVVYRPTFASASLWEYVRCHREYIIQSMSIVSFAFSNISFHVPKCQVLQPYMWNNGTKRKKKQNKKRRRT